MEELSGCKILVRGKGSQKEGQPPQPDDNEDQHVLIVGETEANIGKYYIYSILIYFLALLINF